MVLDHLAHSHGALTFSEIVAATGFTKSSAHRIIAILLGEDLVGFDPISKQYELGVKPIRWARAAWQKTDLQQITDAQLVKLRDETELNVAVAIRSYHSILFIRTFDVQSVRYAAKIGEQAPLHCTAAGKVLLAYVDQQSRQGLPDGYEMEKFTEFTLTSKKALAADLKKVRDRGIAICDREEFLQICGIAAPIRDYQGNVIATLGLWGPSKLAKIETILRHERALCDAAASISDKFGSMA